MAKIKKMKRKTLDKQLNLRVTQDDLDMLHYIAAHDDVGVGVKVRAMIKENYQRVAK